MSYKKFLIYKHQYADRQRIEKNGGDSLSLAEMTKSAINYLDNENGFFMMVEGSKIDWACHVNDAVTTMYETIRLCRRRTDGY